MSCDKFHQLFGKEARFYARAPGRAEILGNHTDYNGGLAMSCALPVAVEAWSAPRNDETVVVYSLNYPSDRVQFSFTEHELTLQEQLPPGHWGRYVGAVAIELRRTVPSTLHGAEIFIQSDVPATGGLSSSAAFEAAIGLSLLAANDITLSPIELARLCHHAENGPLVNVPSGILDQASVFLSGQDKLLLLDFSAPGDYEVIVRTIPADFVDSGLQFLVTFDPTTQRRLGKSGYRERKQSCREGLSAINSILGTHFLHLGEISTAQFQAAREALDTRSKQIRKRVEHVVMENQRVQDAVIALHDHDYTQLGRLLSESGNSALLLFDLAENTEELSFLVNESQQTAGVLGSRNMGGGFSAVTLSLVKKTNIESFQHTLTKKYETRFSRSLSFIPFIPSPAAHHIAL